MLGLDLGVIDWSDPQYAQLSDAIVIDWNNNGFDGGNGITWNGNAIDCSLYDCMIHAKRDVFCRARNIGFGFLTTSLIVCERYVSALRRYVASHYVPVGLDYVFIDGQSYDLVANNRAGDDIYMLVTSARNSYLGGTIDLLPRRPDGSIMVVTAFLQVKIVNVAI